MKQLILLQSYVGLSDFEYVVTCTGRLLRLEEVLRLELTTPVVLSANARSSYTATWYEIDTGDLIHVESRSDDGDVDLLFEVPVEGIPNPPVAFSDIHAGKWLHFYLLRHCIADKR
ncbi:MAG: hypothetical protein UT32_C0007G0010 [Parcubacteria group bacterium GW2011_GWC2_39_14]|nr:MAG: hypothetical protein UT32_C0007G0010 [Parcubacteria group bacterium GW2011_GWC2_39_14]